jgi:hypothetical protein
MLFSVETYKMHAYFLSKTHIINKIQRIQKIFKNFKEFQITKNRFEDCSKILRLHSKIAQIRRWRRTILRFSRKKHTFMILHYYVNF